MQLDKLKANTRLTLMRSLDKKRTTSSQQSHKDKPQHQRKYTIDYNQPKNKLHHQPKEPFKQSYIPRKNQSLPKTLSSYTTQKKPHSHRNRKLVCPSQSKQSDHQHKSQNKFQSLSSIQIHSKSHLTDPTHSSLFSQAINLFNQQKYQPSLDKFLSLQKQTKQSFPPNLYYIGLCYWSLLLPDKAVIYLSKSLDLGYSFSIETYELLSKFYQQTKNYNCALKTLNHWLLMQTNPKAYLLRARIHFQFKQYQKAINDYCQCYNLQPTKLQAYIQQAEATYKHQGIDQALTKYNNLIANYNAIWPQSKHQDINYVKYKKSLLLIQKKNYQQALTELKQVSNPQMQSQVGYYIGIIYTILNSIENALLAFTKAIQSNTSQKFVGQCYYQKFVIMFKKNDFYGIQHQFDIIGEKFSQNQALQVMKKVIEGSIFILKMYFDQGIKTLNSISQNPYYLRNSKIYLSTVTSFKIFAYYSLHKFQQSYNQFNQLKNKKISQSNRYNLAMLKAIIAANSNNFHQSLELFKQAENIQPFNTHTLMVKAIVQIMFYNHIISEKSNPSCNLQITTNQQILLSSQQLLNRSLQKQPQNDQILYLLSTINYQLSQYQSGLKLIRKVIQLSDQHTIKHFYLKANFKLMLGMLPQAISDYSSAILVMSDQQSLKQQLSNQHPQPPILQSYLQRAKCYILTKQYQKAQADLKIFFSNLNNVKKYTQQLDLFMYVGCGNVIINIYKHIFQQQYPPFNKMKCYYLAKQLNNCLNMMNGLLQIADEQQAEEDKTYNIQNLKIDRDCLEALKKSSQGTEIFIRQALSTFQQKIQRKTDGQIFKKSDYIFYSGVMSYLLEDYSKAKTNFIDSKGQKLLSNQLVNSQIDQDLDFDNQLYSLQQINYNIGICDYIQGKWNSYLDHYPAFRKHHQSVTQNLTQQIQQITPFQINNRLCSIYPPIKSGIISFRLSFCLPKLILPLIKFTKNQSIIHSINFKDIDMRPSAPWIQKNKKGIIFTSKVLKDSIDLKSEKSKKGHKQHKRGHLRYREEPQ